MVHVSLSINSRLKHITRDHRGCRAYDFSGIQLATGKGLGICELPSIMCEQEIKDGRLEEILPD